MKRLIRASICIATAFVILTAWPGCDRDFDQEMAYRNNPEYRKWKDRQDLYTAHHYWLVSTGGQKWECYAQPDLKGDRLWLPKIGGHAGPTKAMTVASSATVEIKRVCYQMNLWCGLPPTASQIEAVGKDPSVDFVSGAVAEKWRERR